MPLIDRLKYEGPPGYIVWKYPSEQLVIGAQLIVNESQEAVLFKGGKALDVFGPGTHTLRTANIPLLQKLINLPFGGKTPFTAEVYYINKAAPLDIKWGTRDPFSITDPKYQVIVPVGCSGTLGIRVKDSRPFLAQVVGGLKGGASWGIAEARDYFHGAVIEQVKDVVARHISQGGISFTEITAHMDAISSESERRISGELLKFGVELADFRIMSIHVPDEEIKKLKEILLQRAEFDQLGSNYQLKRQLDILEKTAENPGGPAATHMAEGLGIGLGIGAAQAAARNLGNLLNQASPSTPPSENRSTCGQCHHRNLVDAKFCSECGTKL